MEKPLDGGPSRLPTLSRVTSQRLDQLHAEEGRVQDDPQATGRSRRAGGWAEVEGAEAASSAPGRGPGSEPKSAVVWPLPQPSTKAGALCANQLSMPAAAPTLKGKALASVPLCPLPT